MRKTVALLMLAVVVPSCGGDDAVDNSPPGGPYSFAGEITYDKPSGPAGAVPYQIKGELEHFAGPSATRIAWHNKTMHVGGTGTSRIDVESFWISGMYFSGTYHRWTADVDLVPGDNEILITVQDNEGKVAERTITVTCLPLKPEIAIVSPAGSGTRYTMESPLTLSGTASSKTGLSMVTWANELTGSTGVATGLETWLSLVPLGVGSNRIVMTATDVAGGTASAELTVAYPALPPPVLTLDSPVKDGVTTAVNGWTWLSGTATAAAGVSRVELRVNGQSRQTRDRGFPAWNFGFEVPSGTSLVEVTAYDSAGRSTRVTVTVTCD